MNTILYPPRYSPTARRLASALGLRRNRGPADVAVRWGDVSERVDFDRVINPVHAIRAASDKVQGLVTLNGAGIPVPPFARFADLTRYPLIGRTRRHSGGNGVWIVRTLAEAEQAEREGAQYFLELVGSRREYRVHVMGGCVIYTQMKMGQRRTEEQRTGLGRYIRSRQYGWWLNTAVTSAVIATVAVRAVVAFGLDFGAVDVLDTRTGPVVLEVNTAPGLSSPAFPAYVAGLRKLIEGVV